MAKNKDKVRRPRTRLLLPGQFHKSSTVVAPIKLAEGGILKGNIKYILDTWRTDGQWKIFLQWIEQR